MLGARKIFRDLIDMSADVAITEREVTVRFHRGAHPPIVMASDRFKRNVRVPWWEGLPLRLIEYALRKLDAYTPAQRGRKC